MIEERFTDGRVLLDGKEYFYKIPTAKYWDDLMNKPDPLVEHAQGIMNRHFNEWETLRMIKLTPDEITQVTDILKDIYFIDHGTEIIVTPGLRDEAAIWTLQKLAQERIAGSENFARGWFAARQSLLDVLEDYEFGRSVISTVEKTLLNPKEPA